MLLYLFTKLLQKDNFPLIYEKNELPATIRKKIFFHNLHYKGLDGKKYNYSCSLKNKNRYSDFDAKKCIIISSVIHYTLQRTIKLANNWFIYIEKVGRALTHDPLFDKVV